MCHVFCNNRIGKEKKNERKEATEREREREREINAIRKR
jgi:hypothetical protein